jgi:hypothetical protein
LGTRKPIADNRGGRLTVEHVPALASSRFAVPVPQDKPVLKGRLLAFLRLILSAGGVRCHEMIGCIEGIPIVKGEIEMNRLFQAVANSEALSEKWEELGITRRKIFQYLDLFCVLFVIYLLCISNYIKFVVAADSAYRLLGLGDLMRPLYTSCLFSALPFGVLAYSDKNWRSGDAAAVICGAWTLVYVLLSFQYDKFCPMWVGIPLFPFILSALLAHTVGKFCQRREHAGMKSTHSA